MSWITRQTTRGSRTWLLAMLLIVVCVFALLSFSGSTAQAAALSPALSSDTIPAQSGTPAIQLDPTTGSEGTVVTVNGSGFPGGTVVYVLLAGSVRASDSRSSSGPQVYAAGLTDFNGNMWTQFAMPANWPDGTPIQSGTLTLVATTFGFTVQASAAFDYVAAHAPPSNPTANASPSSGGPGTRITLLGEGFTPNAQLYATTP